MSDGQERVAAYDRALNGERFSVWEMFGPGDDRGIAEVDATEYVKTLEVHNQELRRQIATLAADLEMERAK